MKSYLKLAWLLKKNKYTKDTNNVNKTKTEVHRYLLKKKDGMPTGASPSLDAWVSFEIFTWGALGIPKLELLPLFILLILIVPRSSNTLSTQNLTKTLWDPLVYKANHYYKYCCKPIHILFLHYSYCNITFPWLNPLIETDSFIKTSKQCIKNRICLKQDSLK